MANEDPSKITIQTKDYKSGKRNPNISPEMYAVILELQEMGIGFDINSIEREKSRGRHKGGDALDLSINEGKNFAFYQFVFGPNFDPRKKENGEYVVPQEMTPEAVAFFKKHNLRLFDERNRPGAEHYHLDLQSEEYITDRFGEDKIVDNTGGNEDYKDFTTGPRKHTIEVDEGKSFDGYFYGVGNRVYHKNDYNQSEYYQTNINNKESIDLTEYIDIENGGRVNLDITAVNETVKFDKKELGITTTEEVTPKHEVILHTYGKNTESNIYPSIRSQLENKGYEVVTITNKGGLKRDVIIVNSEEEANEAVEFVRNEVTYPGSMDVFTREHKEKEGEVTTDANGNVISLDGTPVVEPVVEEVVEEEVEPVVKETKTNNMPPGVHNPTTEMLDTAPEYNSSQEVKDAFDNGEINDGDIINVNGWNHQAHDRNGHLYLTPYREDTNTFDGGEGGTEHIDALIEEEIEQEENYEEEEEEGTKIFKNDYQVLDAMANGDISSTDVIRIEYDDSDPNKPEGQVYEGTVKMRMRGEEEEVQFLDGTHTNVNGASNIHEDGAVVRTTPATKEKEEEVVAEEETVEEPAVEEEVEDPLQTEIEDTSDITTEPTNVDVEDTNEVTEENTVESANINDDKETIRNRLLSEQPELANNTEELDELVNNEYDNNQWELDEIEELKDNKKYIDKIFADNPEIAAKYEGVPIEEYSKVDGFYEEVYDKIYEEIEVEEENEKQVNKEETGVFETNKERAQRESDIAIYNELEAKKLDGTITPEEESQMEEIENNYGGWNPNELHEQNKTEQAERDLNESEGRGAISNAEVEQQEIEAEDLEAEREENFRLYGKRETDEQKYTRIENEKNENEEKGLGRLTNVQVEDQNVIFSNPKSEKALRNELKTNLKNKENALKAAESEEEKEQIKNDIKTTKLALEYLELKKEYGNKDDVFDINTFREAVENNDNQQISMFYNDQRGEVISKLESQRKSIVDGTFEGTELEKQKILSTLEELNTSTQKSELPEFDSEYDKLLYMTNATNEDIDKLKALEKDRKYIEKKGKVNTQILNIAAGDVANSGLTDANMSTNHDYIAVINPKDGSTQYVKKEWVNSFDANDEEIERLEKKEREGSITDEEKVTLKNYKTNRFHSRDVLEQSDINMETFGHPSGRHSTYRGGTDEIDAFLENRKRKIFETGANPDINLTPEQIAIFDNIQSENYDMSNLENDLDQIVSYSPEAFDFDTTLETTTDEEPRSLGPTGQEILQGTIDVATGIMDSFGGPDALINAVMGKKALAAAMKDVTPMQQAKLSPMFNEHLRDAKELSKKGYHPAEELKIRRGIDKAYQQGLENTVRGTAGDRAKFLAASGIFDAKRSLALLEVAAQDAELQRENKKAYTELLTYKENFDAKQQEAKRTENLQMQLANKKAASEFAGLTFANALSGMNNSSIYDKLKQNLMNDFTNNGNFQLTSPFVDDNTTTEPTETEE